MIFYQIGSQPEVRGYIKCDTHVVARKLRATTYMHFITFISAHVSSTNAKPKSGAG